MRKCYRFFIALMIAGFLAGCGQEKPQETKSIPDTQENRLAETKRYLEAVPPREMMADVGRNVAANAPEPQAAQFLKSFMDNLDMASIERTMKESLPKHFTADELRALADFFGSPVGKSAMSKYGAYMGSIMPVIQQEVAKAMQKGMEGMASQGGPKQEPGAAPEAPAPPPETTPPAQSETTPPAPPVK